MRWKALYVLLGLVILGALLGWLFLDKMLEWSMERSLETIVGAKTEIDGVHLDLRKLMLRIDRLQQANPRNTWRNIIEADRLQLRLALTPLYQGKLVIEEIVIEDLMLDSPRKTDGRLRRRLLPGPLGEAQARLNRGIAQIPLLDPSSLAAQIDPDKLIPSYEFKTDTATEALRARVEETGRRWEADRAELDEIKAQAAKLEKRAKELSAVKAGNVVEIRQQLSAYKELQGSVKELKSRVDAAGDGFAKESSALAASIKDLDETAEADYRGLLALAKLPDLASFDYAQALFGRALLNGSAIFTDLADKLQAMLPVKLDAPPKESKPPRGGMDITFPGRRTYPRLLIERVTITGRGAPDTAIGSFRARGEAGGITSEPPIYGRPMTAEIAAAAGNNARLHFRGSIDHVTPAFADRFELDLTELPLAGIDLGRSPYLPNSIASGRADIQTRLEMRPDYFSLAMRLTGRGIAADYDGSPADGDLGVRVVREVLSRIDLLTIDYSLEKTAAGMKMRVASNIDSLIADRLREMVGERFEAAAAELRAEVDARLRKRRAELEAMLDESRAAFNEELTAIRASLDREKDALRERELKLQAELDAALRKNLPKLPGKK